MGFPAGVLIKSIMDGKVLYICMRVCLEKKCWDLLNITILSALVSSLGAVVAPAKALWKFTREDSCRS